MDYNQTVHLPQTEFPMRAGLPKREPELLNGKWEMEMYNKLMAKNEGKPKFILHDGPPYANGHIHIGHALNKILKDFIVKYKNMTGFQAPYVPGFDTHGLPIELKALASVGDKKKDISKLELRKLCHEFATEHIDIMNEQFARLGVIGDFEHPYLTLKPEFEARQVEIFGTMASKGYIYKGMKPVYWCPECRTALAEAEIEYGDDECDSLFVRFAVTEDPNGVLAKYGIPMEADLVFDVRFLPNPYYVEELRPKTGKDKEVYDYIFNFPQTEEFMEKLKDMISFSLPLYCEEGKTVLVIAVGCTGGHHRSVAVTRALAEYIGELGYQVSENHRDISRG